MMSTESTLTSSSSLKKSDWVGKLLLDNITVIDDFKEVKEQPTSCTTDICQFLPGGANHNNIDTSSTFLRFDALQFPPSTSDKDAFDASNPTYIKLRGELQRAAIQCGYKLVPKSNARFVCKCSRTYANGIGRKACRTAAPGQDNATIRRRNTSTSLPTNADETCKFSIKFRHDSVNGYFIIPRFGNAIHSHHPYIDPTADTKKRIDLTKLATVKLGAAAHDGCNNNDDNNKSSYTEAGHVVDDSQIICNNIDEDDHFNVNIDDPTDTANEEDIHQKQPVNARQTLQPLLDVLCSLYERKDAAHQDMPNIDSVVDAMKNKIHEINDFFQKQQQQSKKKKKRKRPNHNNKDETTYLSEFALSNNTKQIETTTTVVAHNHNLYHPLTQDYTTTATIRYNDNNNINFNNINLYHPPTEYTTTIYNNNNMIDLYPHTDFSRHNNNITLYPQTGYTRYNNNN